MLEYADRVVELRCGGTGYTLALLIGRSFVAFFCLSDHCKSLRTVHTICHYLLFHSVLLYNQCSWKTVVV